MPDERQQLTPEQTEQVRKKGGAAALRKLETLGKKMDRGKAGKAEEVSYEKTFVNCVSLIDETISASRVPPGDADALMKVLNEEGEKLFQQYEQGKMSHDEMTQACKELPRKVTQKEEKPNQDRLANLRRFKNKSKQVTMFSKKLDCKVAIISKEKQREEIPDEFTVYHIDEVIAMTEAGIDNMEEYQKSIQVTKEVFDGEVVRAG
jgi:hypothetical protein